VATEETDSDLADAADQLSSDTKPEKKALLSQISERLRSRAERRGVEIEGGYTVSSVMSKFLRDHEDQGVEFVGTEIQKLAFELKGSDDRHGSWVRYQPDRHAGCKTRLLYREFARIPQNSKGLSEIWMQQAGRLLHIGHKLSQTLLERLQRDGGLTDEGQKLLAEPVAADLVSNASSMVADSPVG